MSNLPSLLGSSAVSVQPLRRDVVRTRRLVSRDVAAAQGQAQAVAERGRSKAQAIESVAVDAMQAGTTVARHAVILANAAPVAEPMLRCLMEQTGLALGQVLRDAARELR